MLTINAVEDGGNILIAHFILKPALLVLSISLGERE
jgi:hypothetical protein